MLELFIEMVDTIFYDGYAEQLSKENPARFNFELEEFMNAYS
jgi:hypothetical protein